MLEIGSIIYYIEEKVNLGRTRYTMTDADGVEWHRYDQPLREYILVEYRVKGILQTQVQGELVSYDDCYEDGEILYHLENIANSREENIFSYQDSEDFFISRSAAENRIIELEQKEQ